MHFNVWIFIIPFNIVSSSWLSLSAPNLTTLLPSIKEFINFIRAFVFIKYSFKLL